MSFGVDAMKFVVDGRKDDKHDVEFMNVMRRKMQKGT